MALIPLLHSWFLIPLLYLFWVIRGCRNTTFSLRVLVFLEYLLSVFWAFSFNFDLFYNISFFYQKRLKIQWARYQWRYYLSSWSILLNHSLMVKFTLSKVSRFNVFPHLLIHKPKWFRHLFIHKYKVFFKKGNIFGIFWNGPLSIFSKFWIARGSLARDGKGLVRIFYDILGNINWLDLNLRLGREHNITLLSN